MALECKYYKTVELIASDTGKPNRSSIVIGEVVGIHIDESIIVDGMIDIRKCSRCHASATWITA